METVQILIKRKDTLCIVLIFTRDVMNINVAKSRESLKKYEVEESCEKIRKVEKS